MESEAGYPQDVQRQGANEQLAMETSRMSELVDRLESVLQPALRPAAPAAVGPDKRADTSQLRDGVYRFGELNSRLQAIIERIDV